MTHAFPTRRSSDLAALRPCAAFLLMSPCAPIPRLPAMVNPMLATLAGQPALQAPAGGVRPEDRPPGIARSEEHTSELQSLMRISYAVFCLKKNTKNKKISHDIQTKHTLRDK